MGFLVARRFFKPSAFLLRLFFGSRVHCLLHQFLKGTRAMPLGHRLFIISLFFRYIFSFAFQMAPELVPSLPLQPVSQLKYRFWMSSGLEICRSLIIAKLKKRQLKFSTQVQIHISRAKIKELLIRNTPVLDYIMLGIYLRSLTFPSHPTLLLWHW